VGTDSVTVLVTAATVLVVAGAPAEEKVSSLRKVAAGLEDETSTSTSAGARHVPSAAHVCPDLQQPPPRFAAHRKLPVGHAVDGGGSSPPLIQLPPARSEHVAPSGQQPPPRDSAHWNVLTGQLPTSVQITPVLFGGQPACSDGGTVGRGGRMDGRRMDGWE